MLNDALARLPVRSSTDPLDRDAASRDLWPRGTLLLRDGERTPAPAAVAWPTSTAEVAALLAAARETGTPVVPYGAGSGVCGGASGRTDALVIDLKRMNRLVAIDPERQVAWAQAGLLGQHLEDLLERQGFRTAHSPSSIACSTVGGWVAARSAGQFSSRYGTFDDMLVAVRAETPVGAVAGGAWGPDGGPDLLPLLSGSEGTLGVVTDAAFRIVPLPARRWLRGLALPDLPTAWDAMRRLMQLSEAPFVLRLYDPIDTRIGGPARAARRAQRSGPPAGHRIVERLRAAVQSVPALREHLLDLPLALPRLVNRIADNLGDEVLLIVGWEGSDTQVEAALAAAAPILAEGRDLGPDPGTYWYAHRHDVSYKLAPVFAGGGWADTMEVACTWSRLSTLHERVRHALGGTVAVMAHFSHAWREGCSIYFSFAGRGGVDVYDRTWRAALQAAREAGGTVTHHHGVGQLKATACTQEAAAALRVWRRAKDRLDPTHLLNPGRLFDVAAPFADGPPRPEGPGPVYALSELDRLADVDPTAPPRIIERSLAEQGWALRLPPDRPFLEWIQAYRRGHLGPTEAPLFSVQARFPDGISARISPAPRSAAGPDLRWSLAHDATLERVSVPIVPHTEALATPVSPRGLGPACLPPDAARWRAEAP